jgi:cytochrome P450
VRPELLLTDDPPKHTRVRAVVSNALSPKALNHMAGNFRRDARSIVEGLRARAGEPVDAVAEITQPFVYKVLPDLIGLPEEGREHMYAFGNMVWATMGPMNELFQEAMQDTGGAVLEWAGKCCNRENLSAGSLGMAMYEAADRGEVSQQEANLLVGILLSAAADTTVLTLANTIRAFSQYPGQYQMVRVRRSYSALSLSPSAPGVGTDPGASAFTRTLRGPSSAASTLVSVTMARASRRKFPAMWFSALGDSAFDTTARTRVCLGGSSVSSSSGRTELGSCQGRDVEEKVFQSLSPAATCS